MHVCPAVGANVSAHDESGISVDVSDKNCIHCGACIKGCVHKARGYNDSLDDLLLDMKRGTQVSLIVDPTFIVAYGMDQRGTANSTILISWDIGMGLGILVGGIVSELLGYSAAFWTVVAVNATGVATFFLATRTFFLKRNLNETVR